jgi:hypothetical protein
MKIKTPAWKREFWDFGTWEDHARLSRPSSEGCCNVVMMQVASAHIGRYCMEKHGDCQGNSNELHNSFLTGKALIFSIERFIVRTGIQIFSI